MNESTDEDKGTLLALLLESFPADDRHIFRTRWPGKTILLLTKFLQLHRELTLRHLILGEHFKVRCEANLRHDGDEPFGGVVLIPLDRIAVVHWKLMVEVVVAFTNGYKGSEHMISWSVLVIKRSITQPVGKRVYTEGGLRVGENGKRLSSVRDIGK